MDSMDDENEDCSEDEGCGGGRCTLAVSSVGELRNAVSCSSCLRCGLSGVVLATLGS